MSFLYRPRSSTYILPGNRYCTPDGKRVTKQTPGAIRKAKVSKLWWGRYTDGTGNEQQVKLSENKEIARRMLAKLAGDAQLAGVGIMDPHGEHRARPVAEHVEDYRRYLVGKGDTLDVSGALEKLPGLRVSSAKENTGKEQDAAERRA